MTPATLFERVGGDAFFETLTERFYQQVAADPVLAPMYPSEPADLEEARGHLRDFLIQFWGGPNTYQERRGHPRLRQRHAPFAIGAAERDAWVTHMDAAVRSMATSPLDEMQLLRYFDAAATQLINRGP